MRKGLFGRDRICGVVAALTAKEMAQQLRQALRWTRTVELRLDWLKNRRERAKFIATLSAHKPRATLIATCRRMQGGGRLQENVIAQGRVLNSALRAGCQWCDLEFESVRNAEAGFMWSGPIRRPPKKLMMSFHDFRRTPRDLELYVKALSHWDAVKVATQCNSIADSLRVLALARGKRNLVAVPMGEAGLPARVLALREGSALAYAAVEKATAPGQLSLEEMKGLYRADKLDRRTRVYGVIGDPIQHSLSPQLHSAGFQARRINAVHLPFLVRDLRDFLAAIKPLGIAGFNVTLPHKQTILRYLDGCDPLAARIGAVNTVVVRGGGKLYGYNTDYVGVLRALEKRVQLRGSRVLIYGAGGAARAAAFALVQAGAVVNICARRIEKARALARTAGAEAIERARLKREFFDAIINATPIGMHLTVGRSPLEPRELNCRIVMDLIYRPSKTKLLQLAERRGIEAISGLEMFLAQGTAQWEIWTGLRAPEAAMRRAVIAALRRGEPAGKAVGARR